MDGDLAAVSLQQAHALLEFVRMDEDSNWCQARVKGRRRGGVIMLPTDMSLLSNLMFQLMGRDICRRQGALFSDFAVVLAKLLKLGTR